MNNSTGTADTVIFMKNLNDQTSMICGCILYFDSVCLLILSICWSTYLITQLMKDRKKQKLKFNTKYCRTNWCRENEAKNYNSNKVKNILLIMICWSESVLIISMCLYGFGKWNQTTREHPLNKIIDLKHEFLVSKRYTESLRNPIILISNIMSAISACSIFLFVNILTQYLVHTYSYYQRVFKLKQKIIISISFFTILFILGLIKPLILLQYTLTSLLIISQFIILCNATSKLQKLLKQRLKDSITHENQSASVIIYYQLAKREYRLCSVILLISLFLQMVGFSKNLIQPVVMEILDLMNLKETFPSYVHVYDLMISSLEMVFLSIGLSMLIIPYCIVSIRRLIRYLRKIYKVNTCNLGKNTKVQQLLKNNYDAYYRSHYY